MTKWWEFKRRLINCLHFGFVGSKGTNEMVCRGPLRKSVTDISQMKASLRKAITTQISVLEASIGHPPSPVQEPGFFFVVLIPSKITPFVTRKK